MDDTELHLRLRKDHFNGIGKAFKAIDTGDKNIFQAACLELRQNAEPELCSFGFGQPQPEDLFCTIKVNAEGQIDCLVDDLLILPDFDNNAVEINNRINSIQGPVLLLYHAVNDRLSDFGNQRCRDIGTVHFFKCSNDIAGAHSFGVQRENLVIKMGETSLPFFNNLRLELSITVTRCFNLDLAMATDQALTAMTISVVACIVCPWGAFLP